MTSADGSGSSTSSSTGAEASTGGGTNPSGSGSSGGTTGSSSGSTSGSTTVVGTSTSSSSGDSSSTSSGDDTTGSETTVGTTSSAEDTGDTGDETGGVATVCEEGGELVLTWSVSVPGGTFPDDIPEDLSESCAFTPSAIAGEIPFTCEGVDFLVTIESTPAAVLPDTAQAVEVRLHRQAGPLGFPDFWVDLGFADGERVSLISSSVLQPNNNTVEIPYSMALSEEECGPYNIGNPIQPKDPCGDQMWLGLEIDLDANLTVFHGSHAEGENDGNDVGFWVAAARDYGVLPKFCDFSATFYSAMVVTGGE